jgi:SAM-dependent methyltransferase
LFDILKTKKYNTDKSEAYLHDYHRTFGHLRDKQIALMEIGVNRGGSLYLWRDYFPHGSILGIDLNPPLDFKDETGRCRLLRCDQGDTDTLRRLAASTSPQGFDIIIDDASHLASLTAATFKALFYDHLRPGGYYAIEDWGTGYWEMWPDGVQPLPPLEPNFPNVGKRFPSHEAGMAGFVKQLVDECALADICHPRFGIPRTRRNSIRGMHISTGLVIVEKASE